MLAKYPKQFIRVDILSHKISEIQTRDSKTYLTQSPSKRLHSEFRRFALLLILQQMGKTKLKLTTLHRISNHVLLGMQRLLLL